MTKIVRIPKVLDDFFEPFAHHFNKRSFIHFKVFCAMIAMSSEHKTVRAIASWVCFGAGRSKLNDFLTLSPWQEESVLKEMATRRLQQLFRPQEPVFIILDDSKKKKTGKHVQGIGKLFDPVSKTYIQGHQILTATLYYRGQTIPFGIRLYLKKEVAKKLNRPFKKLSTLAKELIESFEMPFHAPVYVLSDSFYVNKVIIQASRQRGFHFIGALKLNRTFTLAGRKTNVSSYIGKAFKRKKKTKTSLKTRQGSCHYRFVCFQAFVSKIGNVQIVFSQKGNHRKVLAIVCTDLKLNPKSIILFYSFRWSIEIWFKQAKQHLSFGALHRRMLMGVIKHLHLSACAYLLLTHLQPASEKAKQTNVVASILDLQNQLKGIFQNDLFDFFLEKQHKKSKHNQLFITEIKQMFLTNSNKIKTAA